MTPATKIDLNHSRIGRMSGPDDLAKALFPNNRTHQRLFLAIFVEIKWAPEQFLPSLAPVADQQSISMRTLETVRSKMRRLGILDHVSRFNQRHGYREGWVLSPRFEKSLVKLAAGAAKCKSTGDPMQEQKDRDAWKYL